MELRALLCMLVLFVATAAFPGSFLAQEPERQMDPAMEAWLKYASPGEHHKHLEALVGTWDAKTKFWPAPDAPVQASSGLAKNSSILDGRFVQVTYQSEFMGQPFSGMGFMGYDNYQQKYVDVWIDTMGTMMMTSEGTCDGSGKVITMRGEYADPMSGGGKSVRSVYRFVDPNEYVLEMYDTTPEGKEFKSLEITHTRKGSEAGRALAPTELDRAVDHLAATRQALLDATAGLSEAQWNFKPGPGRWSVAECVEHIALSEDLLFKLVSEQVMKTPASTEEREDVQEVDAMVLAAIPNRSQRFQAPQEVVPKGRFGSPKDTLKHFLNGRARTVNFLKTTPDVRAHAIDSPLGKKLDAYQWILYISAHSERHTKQINEVKADSNFPRE